MRLSPHAVSWVALIGLVAALLGLTGFAVLSEMSAQSSVRDVRRAIEVSAAYNQATDAISQTEIAAVRFLEEPSREHRVDFEQAADRVLGAMRVIQRSGNGADRTLAASLIFFGVPQLEQTQRYFQSVENGTAPESTLPSTQLTGILKDTLRAPANARTIEATRALDDHLASQEFRLKLTLVVYGAGMVLILAFLAVLRSYGTRHVKAQIELTKLREAALTDSLTALGNHRAFDATIREEMARHLRHRDDFTLALIDVDEFKEVNDTWGHERGDAVLNDLAGILHSACRAGDCAFRIGGDEFALILSQTSAEEALPALERVREEARQLLAPATISIGLASAAGTDGDLGLLRERADSALYEAKQRGRNIAVVFEHSSNRVPLFPAAKIQAVRRLIQEEAMDAAFQPIWNLRKGELLAFEALARPGELYELNGPQEAFDIAERIGRSHDLDAVCRRAILRRAGQIPAEALLFVNLSPYTLDHANFSPTQLRAEFLAAGLEPERVVLEITEKSSAPVGVVVAHAILLRELGFKLALDDVGSGNAGLDMLRKVAVDYVKIDRGVVVSALQGSTGRAVLMAIMAFANEAGAFVIAEGIDDERMLHLLQRVSQPTVDPVKPGIHGVQGYLLGRPAATVDGLRIPPFQAAA